MSARDADGGGGTALLVVDMLNAYDHPDAEELAASAEKAVPVISRLIERAREADVPVVYVNDNYGDWSATAASLSDRALAGKRPDLIEPIVPPDGTPFVLKARHSIFYETPTEYLLRDMGCDRLVLAGQVTEQCILYSALDAYVRHFEVAVPSDAVAHIRPELADAALQMMAGNMSAAVAPAEELEL